MLTHEKYSTKVMLEAKRLYVDEENNATQVSKKLGMTVQTLGIWIKMYKWKDARFSKKQIGNLMVLAIQIAEYLKKSEPELYERAVKTIEASSNYLK